MKTIAKVAWAMFGLFLLLSVGCVHGRADLPSVYPGDAGLTISGDVDDETDDKVAAYVDASEAAGRAMTIEINSDGGMARPGLAAFRKIAGARVPSVCLVNGRAASAAFLILQACTSRRMTSDSKLATHRPSVVFPAPVTLTPEAVRAVASNVSALSDLWDMLLRERLGMTKDAYDAKVADGAAWIMTADEAIEANAIDVVVDGARSPL